jgi:hypothetical protein
MENARRWTEEENVDIREAYPLMDAVAYQEGWDAPEMDSYNIYARKPQHRANKPLMMVYMNSTNPQANIRYEVLKQNLGLDPEQHPLTQRVIEYRKKRGGTVVSKEEFVHEVLHFKTR